MRGNARRIGSFGPRAGRAGLGASHWRHGARLAPVASPQRPALLPVRVSDGTADLCPGGFQSVGLRHNGRVVNAHDEPRGVCAGGCAGDQTWHSVAQGIPAVALGPTGGLGAFLLRQGGPLLVEPDNAARRADGGDCGLLLGQRLERANEHRPRHAAVFRGVALHQMAAAQPRWQLDLGGLLELPGPGVRVLGDPGLAARQDGRQGAGREPKRRRRPAPVGSQHRSVASGAIAAFAVGPGDQRGFVGD